MKLFGHFLLEKKLINEETLLSALAEQGDALPSICSIVHKQNLLPASKQLEVIAYQVEHELEYRQACRQLGYWTETLQNEVQKHLRKNMPPLGKILLARGALSVDNLNNALSEYVAELPNMRSESVAEAAARIVEQNSNNSLLQHEFSQIFDNELKEHLLSNLQEKDSRIPMLIFAAHYCGATESELLLSELLNMLKNNPHQDQVTEIVAKIFTLQEATRNRNAELNS